MLHMVLIACSSRRVCRIRVAEGKPRQFYLKTAKWKTDEVRERAFGVILFLRSSANVIGAPTAEPYK
jgi:hypothetical protein